MNLPSWGWAILLLVLTLVWFVLPLVPAFWELWRNRDADPVEVDPLGSALIPLSDGSLDVEGAAGPVRLAAGQRFYRVQGSCIRFGRGPWLEDRPDALGVHVAFDERPTTHAGSLTIPRGQTLQGSQVVHGDLVMEESSVLDGSAKVHGQVRMARGCLVTGTVFGMDRMAVGPWGRAGVCAGPCRCRSRCTSRRIARWAGPTTPSACRPGASWWVKAPPCMA